MAPNVKAGPNSLWRIEDVVNPALAEQEGYVLPNCSVLYGFGFLDLQQEPVIMTMPDSDGLYYCVETVSMWTDAFAYPAGAAAGYKGGKVAYCAPGWQGELPSDVKRIDCPTPWILIQPRVHVPDPIKPAGARKVLDAITLQGLSAYQGKPAMAAPHYDYAARPSPGPNRFWTIPVYDARTDQISELGLPYGTRPGFYMIVGPNWKGDTPPGIADVVRSSTELRHSHAAHLHE